MPAPFEIRPALTPADLNDTAALFEAYAARLGVDLAYQDFATELASLPGKYAPPTGALLLAHNPAPIGCVALRALTDGACEMKRLYVAADARGLGLGRALAEAILAEGRRLGYREMRLDTLPTMGPAIDLYRDLGFRPTAPYYDTPIRGTLFLSCTL